MLVRVTQQPPKLVDYAPPEEQTPKPPPRDGLQRKLDDVLPDGWWLWLPMALFLTFLAVGGYGEPYFGEFGAYAITYVARTLVVGGLILYLWPRLMSDVQWTHLGQGVVFGIVGVVQWIGCDKLLLAVQSAVAPDEDSPLRVVFTVLGTVDTTAGYNPWEYIANPLVLFAFVAIRLLGPVLVVPIMEEVFWRDWLWRGMIAPNNYRMAKVGEFDWTAFLVTSFAFSVVHPQRLVAVGWGLLVAWLLIRTRSLGAIIVMHAVTNLLLGVYVLTAGPVFGWKNEWYFW